MRKAILFLFVLSLVGFISCKDESAPVVLLKGEIIMEHVLNSSFDEPGYVAFDDEDGDITDKVIVDSLNVNEAGEHIIKYTVADTEGNTADAKRTVVVYNEADNYAGVWVGEYVYPYPSVDKVEYNDKITTSTTKNMGIIISDFGGNTGANVTGVIRSNKITFNDQTVNGEAFTVQHTSITDNSSRITIEYTIGNTKGVLVLAKQ